MPKKGYPKWEQIDDYRVGLEVLELAEKYRKFLVPRVDAGLIEGLKEDLDKLGSIGEEKKKVAARVKGFTGSQDLALKSLFNWCVRVREALKRGKAAQSVQKSAGVGSIFPNKNVRLGVAAANAILETYDRNPEVFRNCGVLPEDITQGKALLEVLLTQDELQEREKAKKKDTTASRNALRVRIENAVDKIIGAANVAFWNNPEILKLFTDAIPGTYKAKKEKEKGKEEKLN